MRPRPDTPPPPPSPPPAAPPAARFPERARPRRPRERPARPAARPAGDGRRPPGRRRLPPHPLLPLRVALPRLRGRRRPLGVGPKPPARAPQARELLRGGAARGDPRGDDIAGRPPRSPQAAAGRSERPL